KRIFEGEFGDVIAVTTGELALREVDAQEPDIIAMEVQLTGLSGIETMRHHRALSCRAPVSLTSSGCTTAHAIKTIQRDAYDNLLKPSDLPRLKRLMEEALRVSRDAKKVVSIAQDAPVTDADSIVGRSPAMQAAVTAIGRVAPTDATV